MGSGSSKRVGSREKCEMLNILLFSLCRLIDNNNN